jgi:hypothetical protein
LSQDGCRLSGELLKLFAFGASCHTTQQSVLVKIVNMQKKSTHISETHMKYLLKNQNVEISSLCSSHLDNTYEQDKMSFCINLNTHLEKCFKKSSKYLPIFYCEKRNGGQNPVSFQTSHVYIMYDLIFILNYIITQSDVHLAHENG